MYLDESDLKFISSHLTKNSQLRKNSIVFRSQSSADKLVFRSETPIYCIMHNRKVDRLDASLKKGMGIELVSSSYEVTIPQTTFFQYGDEGLRDLLLKRGMEVLLENENALYNIINELSGEQTVLIISQNAARQDLQFGYAVVDGTTDTEFYIREHLGIVRGSGLIGELAAAKIPLPKIIVTPEMTVDVPEARKIVWQD